MNIYEKLQEMRCELQNRNLKKSGKNVFAGYDYFELQDIIPTINILMQKRKVTSSITFDKDMAVLAIINSEKPEEVVEFTSPVEMAILKGCHNTQNLGATITYIRRYLYINAFEIAEYDALDRMPLNAPQTAGKEAAEQHTPPQAKFDIKAKIGGAGKHKNETWAEVDIDYLEKCKDFEKLPVAFRDKCKKAIELRLPQAEIKEPEKAQPKKSKKSEPTYTVRPGEAPWEFKVHKSVDGKYSATYNVNTHDKHCNCAARVPCKHFGMCADFVGEGGNKPVEPSKEKTEGKGRGEQETGGNGSNKGNDKPVLPGQLQLIAKLASQKVIDTEKSDIIETLEGRGLTFKQANQLLKDIPKMEDMELSIWLKKIAAVCETI